jgi:hypothetical protein
MAPSPIKETGTAQPIILLARKREILAKTGNLLGHKCGVGVFARYQTGLSVSEPSLKQQNLDIQKSRPETRAQKLHERPNNSEFATAETD